MLIKSRRQIVLFCLLLLVLLNLGKYTLRVYTVLPNHEVFTPTHVRMRNGKRNKAEGNIIDGQCLMFCRRNVCVCVCVCVSVSMTILYMFYTVVSKKTNTPHKHCAMRK